MARIQNIANLRIIDNGQLYRNLGLREHTLDSWWIHQVFSFMIGTWNVFLVTEGL